MQDMQQDKKHSIHSIKIPGYLKYRHLVGLALPQCMSILLRIMSVTDSVIAFNEAKRVTSTLEGIIDTVSQITKMKVQEIHYRRIECIFGQVYIYTPSYIHGTRCLIMSKSTATNKASKQESSEMHADGKDKSGKNEQRKKPEKETNKEVDVYKDSDLLDRTKNEKNNELFHEARSKKIYRCNEGNINEKMAMEWISKNISDIDKLSETEIQREIDQKLCEELTIYIDIKDSKNRDLLDIQACGSDLSAVDGDPTLYPSRNKKAKISQDIADADQSDNSKDNKTEGPDKTIDSDINKPSSALPIQSSTLADVSNGNSILARIKKREADRREKFILMEKEKEKEIIKALHSIFTLAISSDKKSFSLDFLSRTLSFSSALQLSDVLSHPLSTNLIHTKRTVDKTYLILNISLYHTCNL
ncbi:hypothetical protein NERG_01914 [Nematocida ausubeli]|uniref:Uncharacterized protein n=1 Tax=Nematocida ausubeli (strain ATCC PRA-371 / ERTm2) TaxID=1913371 RepID=H8ZE93_NEMA1|nr:hypothetical protein NERG_01914 [Nematocida ausubeli]